MSIPCVAGGSGHYILGFIRPDSDIETTGWAATGGSGGLYGAINETSASDTEYIASTASIDVCPTLNTYDCEVSLSNPVNTPGKAPSQLMRFRVRYAKVQTGAGGTIDLTVEVREGASVRATRDYNNVGTSISTSTFTLTTSEYNSIVDHTNLRLYFTVDGCVVSEPATARCRIYWAEGEYYK